MTISPRVYTGFQQSRFDWSLECGKLAERDIYTQAMQAVKVERFKNQRDFVDKELGIDVVVTAASGRKYAIAERFRGADYKHFQDLTIREESVYNAGKKLEVHKSIARYMLYGYADSSLNNPPTKITQWLLINLQNTLDLYLSDYLPHGKRYNKDDSSTFLHIKFDILRRAKLVRQESNP